MESRSGEGSCHGVAIRGRFRYGSEARKENHQNHEENSRPFILISFDIGSPSYSL
ncbi:hypothetical protein TIFTF001_025276 [Ficus carica]|uniref:Uncharacterized protein n=1 Tax=Ficus carica TaxID=3494 RepID=A0AA88DH73_FICCA|nr:hypothetical protein TIFTF001_025276 [Ficus carica]